MQIMRWLTNLAYLMAIACILTILLSGPLYKMGWWSLGSIFQILRFTVPMGLAAIVLLLICRFTGAAGNRSVLMAVAVGLIAYMPLSSAMTARKLPYIHDISTDTVNPPEFSASMIEARAEASNPPEYAGQEVATQQADAYPDIQPITLAFPPAEVMSRINGIAADAGWEIVSSSELGMEATDTTFWFGFKDDVVIRLQPQGSGTRVDIRSKSRIGRSDIGKNAARIRAFTQALQG